jgi:hypothetical protein
VETRENAKTPRRRGHGEAATADLVEIICVVELSQTEFITLYWLG